MERNSAHTEANQRLGAAVREQRKAAGLTIAQLAAKALLSPRHVSDVERGVKSPTLDTICRIAEGLGVTPSQLMANVDRLGKDGFRFRPM